MSELNKQQKFTNIYNTYIDEIYRYIYLRIGLAPGIAEDITQEVFIDVYKGFDKFKGLCSERTWVFKIAKNKLYNYYRKQYKRNVESSVETELHEQFYDPLQDVEALIEKSYDSNFVLECLNNLPQHYKIALMLKYIDGKRVSEIACILDKSNKSIDNILHRAKLMFIKEYQVAQDYQKHVD